MASSHLPKKTRLHLIRIGAPGNPKDMFTRVLSGVARLSNRNPDGVAQASLLVRNIARLCNASTQDKNLRNQICRALSRGVDAGLISIKGTDFAITKRAGVVTDVAGRLWMKIPSNTNKAPSKSTEKETRMKKGRTGNAKEKVPLKSSRLTVAGQPANNRRMAASEGLRPVPLVKTRSVRSSRDFSMQTSDDEEDDEEDGDANESNKNFMLADKEEGDEVDEEDDEDVMEGEDEKSDVNSETEDE